MNQLFGILTVLLLLCSNTPFAQQKAVKGSLFEGLVVAGYADRGAYVNCAGPALKYSKSNAAVLIGLLPTIRIKEDRVDEGKPKNTLITPTLGFGLTAVLGHFAIQIPTFYNPKTATADGRWHAGIGIGYKF